MDNLNKHEQIHNSTWIALAILGSTILITMYGETMLLPAISNIIKEFDISYSTSSWILTAYLIAGAVMTPIAGKLSDIYGRKKMVLLIFLIYIIGICIGGLSSNIYYLIVARIIQGIGISMFPIAFGIIRDQFPLSKLSIGVGIFSSMFAGGSVVGLALGGTIIQNFGWKFTFFTIIPISIILWLIIRKYIQNDVVNSLKSKDDKSNKFIISPNKNKPSENMHTTHNSIASHIPDKSNLHKIDLKGALILATMITSFLLTLTFYSNFNDATNTVNYNHNNSVYYFTIISLFSFVTFISLILFIFVEKRVSFPLLPLSLMSDKILLPANIILLTFGITMFMVYQTIPILVTSPAPEGLNGDAFQTALIQLPFMVVFLIFAPSSGWIISKIGNFKPIMIGSVITTIGFFCLFLFHGNGSHISTNLITISAGLALIQVGAFNVILQHTPIKFSGISVSMSVVLILIGSSIGPVFASIYLQTFKDFAINTIKEMVPSSISYTLIFLTAMLISIVSIGSAILLKRRLIQQQQQQ